MINFEQYLIERKSSSAGQQVKRKVSESELRQMIANKDSDIAGVDVSEIEDMSYLFKDSDFGGSWTADLSGWDTSKVENMRGMFLGCTSLTEVELPHTENVENMRAMFAGCKNLKEINLPITRNVKYMFEMFRGCTSLTEVELPHTENVVIMGAMFWGCTSLIKVELANTEKVEDMRYVFNGCENLQQDFSSWDITNVNQKYGMFDGCTKMEDAYKDGKKYYPKGYK